MKIVLPFPDSKLNPNSSKGRHWSAGAALRKVARESAFWIAREALVNHCKHGGKPFAGGALIALDITFRMPTKQQRDLDNLLAALKPSLDGIADCLGTDDCKFEPITIRRDYGSRPGSVVVEVIA